MILITPSFVTHTHTLNNLVCQFQKCLILSQAITLTLGDWQQPGYSLIDPRDATVDESACGHDVDEDMADVPDMPTDNASIYADDSTTDTVPSSATPSDGCRDTHARMDSVATKRPTAASLNRTERSSPLSSHPSRGNGQDWSKLIARTDKKFVCLLCQRYIYSGRTEVVFHAVTRHLLVVRKLFMLFVDIVFIKILLHFTIIIIILIVIIR